MSFSLMRAVLIVQILCVSLWGAEATLALDEFPARDLLSGEIQGALDVSQVEKADELIRHHLRAQNVDEPVVQGLLDQLTHAERVELARYPENLRMGEGLPLGVTILIVLVIAVIFFELVNEDIGLASLETKREMMARIESLPWNAKATDAESGTLAVDGPETQS